MFGSDLQYGYGAFVLIYHSILNPFRSDLQRGYGGFVWIYHSILNTNTNTITMTRKERGKDLVRHDKETDYR